MKIENRDLHGRVWLIQLLATLIYVLFLFALYLTPFFPKHFPAIPKNVAAALAGGFYLLVLLWPNILKLQYIFYSDTGDLITIKTYPVGLFGGRKKAYEIPKKDFVRAEIRFSLFKRRKALIIYQRVGKGIAQYPPVYLNSLRSEDQKRILLSLSRLMAEKGAVV